jgi:C1A family cysteine protease
MGNYSSQTTPTYTLNWKRDTKDSRDLVHKFTVPNDAVKVVDLRQNCPPIYDQGHLGSCTANAIAAAYRFDEMKQKEATNFDPSRLFIYYNERNMEGHVKEDTGASIRDGIKSINVNGVCTEQLWPYDITKFATCPTDDCYKDAETHKSVEYKRVEQNLDQLKQCILSGFPFVFGFEVYESFMTDAVAKTGQMPIPQPTEQLKGGHAVMAVGFDDINKQFIVQNSWGTKWGDKGYFYMPYEYISNNDRCDDFWTVTKVNNNTV